MPLPRGLTFSNRLAVTEHAAFILCQRSGHPKFWVKFDTENEAIEFRSAHDTAFHNRKYRLAGARPSVEIRIVDALQDWLTHIRKLEVAGVRDPETTRYYELVVKRLKVACKESRINTAEDITPSRLSSIVEWFRKETNSEGALIVKSISALKSIVAWKGARADWKIPHDEIRAQPMEKRDLDAETIRNLVAAMPKGSLEEAAAYVKARTGARDVEIYRSKPEEFDLEAGVFAPNISKRRKKMKRHVYALTADVIAKVRPFVERARKRGGYVFAEANGGHVTGGTMRPRIMAASKRAGYVKMKNNKRRTKDGGKKLYQNAIGAIDSIAQIRAEVVTIVEESADVAAAAKHIGHATTATTSRWYLKDRVTAKKIEERRRTAEIIAQALPLSGISKGA